MTNNSASSFLRNSKTKYKGLPKWGKAIVIAFLLFVVLIIIGWFVFSWYLNHHKKEILAKVTTAVSESIEGNFHINDIEPALLEGFPNVAVRFKGVTLSDSLYYKHKTNTINLASVYVKINLFSLITKHPQVMKVTLEDGAIYLFHNKYDYSNTYLFKPKKKADNKKSKKKIELHQFGISNVLVTYDYFDRDKQFKIGLGELDGRIQIKGDLWDINMETQLHFYQMAFNLKKGGFLKAKDLSGDLHILFNSATGKMELPKQVIRVNGTKIKVGSIFNFGAKPLDYSFDIDAPEIGFKEGISFLSDSIQSKISKYDFGHDIAVKVKVEGSFQYPDTPLVHAYWQTEENILSTVFGKFEDVKMSGSFSNYTIPGKGRTDDNSAVTIHGFEGNIMEIPVAIDTLVVYGLINPNLKLNLKSKFDAVNFNALIGNTFAFQGGQGLIDIKYRGPVAGTNHFEHSMNGIVTLKNAAFTYAPRDLKFVHSDINLVFVGKDLLLKNTNMHTANSVLQLDGRASNFMNIYLSDPGKVQFNWNIGSSHIDLNDFKSFLTPKKNRSKKKYNNQKTENLSMGFATMIQQSNMDLHVNVKKLDFNHFTASNILGNVTLTDKAINLTNVSLNHAGGTVKADILTDISSDANTPFSLRGSINNVKIDQLFYAFDEFGQQTLSSRNLKGGLTANIDVKGRLDADGNFIKRSMNGKVSFLFANGELNNFKPLESIQKFIFKKRNLSHVTFNELKNDMDVFDGKIKINPMVITSSAAIIRIEGIYAFDKGTDLSIAVPLRNPEKDKELIAQGKKPKFDKGIVIYLRAKDDDKGEVNISWDPLKKALKKEQTSEQDSGDPDATVHQD